MQCNEVAATIAVLMHVNQLEFLDGGPGKRKVTGKLTIQSYNIM